MEQYDVFLSHTTADKPAVEEIARRLVAVGVRPWLDKWNLIPGEPWQEAIELAMGQCATCTVFVGPSGLGPWQNEEMRTAIERRIKATRKGFRVIPVLLPGARRAERARLPLFLSQVTWVDFRNGLNDEHAFHRLLAGIRAATPGPSTDQDLLDSLAPYRGLQAFDIEDSAFFFGREALTDLLLDKLCSRGPRFVAILGPSGSGKSSLARAGVLASLKQGRVSGSEQWPIVICKPGAYPLESLAAALSQVPEGQFSPGILRDLTRDFLSSPNILHLFTRVALRDSSSDRRLVVLLDQFEEIFTLCQDEELRIAFINNLLYAATTESGQTVVLVTMRAEFYARAAAYPDLAAALSDRQVLVGPMTRYELEQAIVGPAVMVGCQIEPGLLELLLDEASNQPGTLPLIQDALLELWKRRSRQRLTVETYRAIGGVAGVQERRAEAVFGSFTDAEQKICQGILLRLVQIDERGMVAARRMNLLELLSSYPEETRASAVVRAMTDARLLTTENKAGDAGEVEIAHETLVKSWPRFRQWIEQDRSALQFRRRLTEAASEWEENGRDSSYLFTGIRLDQAIELSRVRPEFLSSLERAFLDESLQLRSWGPFSSWRRFFGFGKRQKQELPRQIAPAITPEIQPTLTESLNEQLAVTLPKLRRKLELDEDDLQTLVDLFIRCTAQKSMVAGPTTDYKELRAIPLKIEIDWNGLPFREVMPLIIPRRETAVTNVEVMRELIDKLPGSPPVAIVITLSDEPAAKALMETIRSDISLPYAYDVVILNQADLQRLASSAEPERLLRRLILSQVNLISVSPFRTEGPVSLTRFFGREWEIRQIRENIDTTSFVIIGGRRIGKTSLLYRLRTSGLQRENFYTLYFDCSIVSGTAELKAAPAHDWVPRSPDPGLRTIGDVLAAPPTSNRIVLFLDEADKLVPTDRASGWPFFNELRAVVNGGRARVVIAGERILRKALHDPEGPLFNFADEIRLGPLDFGAVRELVTKPMQQLEIEIAEPQEVLSLIWALTSGHPNVIQRLCQRLIEKLNRESRRQIGLEDVNAIAEDPEFLREDFLETYWERATPLEKIVSLLMAEDPELYTRKAIRQALDERCDLQSTAAEVDDALQNLVELRSILKRTTTGYEFNVPAFPRIVARTITLEDMLEDFTEAYREQNP